MAVNAQAKPSANTFCENKVIKDEKNPLMESGRITRIQREFILEDPIKDFVD
jgi:hypothetical protein